MDWKDKLGSLYDSVPQEPEAENEITDNSSEQKIKKQTLRVELDKRNGKPATLITEFEGTEDELKDLAKYLKVKCGVGGSARGGEILIQGDIRAKVTELLIEKGFKVKKINFK